MKVALLGDVHGNHHALSAVLAAARSHGAELLLVTGDLVGYYFWAKEVLELLAPWNAMVVRGNHEDMLAEARRRPETLERVDKKYGTGLRTALATLSPAQLDWLENLPHPREVELDGRRLLLCHGAPWDVDQYIYPDAKETILRKCAELGYDWIVLGHTHHSMQHRVDATTIVNPGSVGQPRNRQPGAHWGLLDTRTDKMEQFCETYDMTWVMEQSKTRQPDMPYLWNVLSRT